MRFAQLAALLAATVAMGLMAGLFTSWSYAVMPGLAHTDDRTFVFAVQRMNVAIVNGFFLLCFLGALVFTAVAAGLHLPPSTRPSLPWILVGLALYAAVLIVTFRINIPLNNQIDAAGEVDGIADLAAVRNAFESRWVRWNLVRSVASTAAFISLAWALVTSARAS